LQTQALTIGALAAIAALAGCSKHEPAPTPPSAPAAAASAPAAPPCPPEAPVRIDSVAIAASGNTATVQVSPDPRQIGNNAGGVRWTLKNQPDIYEFTADGISFKTNAPAGPASSVPGKSEFVWCFNATPPDQTWPYTIKFVDKNDTTVVWRCDPTIVNSQNLAQAPGPVTVNCTKQP